MTDISALEAWFTETVWSKPPDYWPSLDAKRQGIVRPLLRQLGWHMDDFRVVDETLTGADFGLRDPDGQLVALVLVTNQDEPNTELSVLAGHYAVDLTMQTNGISWKLVLPAHKLVDTKHREVCSITLGEDDIADAAQTLHATLSHEQVIHGHAADYVSALNKQQNATHLATEAVETVWGALLHANDADLIDALACPLAKHLDVDANDHIRTVARAFLHALSVREEPPTPPTPRARGTIVVEGDRFPFKSSLEKVVVLLRTLGELDENMLTQCAQSPTFLQASSRPYLGKGHRALLGEHATPAQTKRRIEPVTNDWWLFKHGLSTAKAKDLADEALRVATAAGLSVQILDESVEHTPHDTSDDTQPTQDTHGSQAPTDTKKNPLPPSEHPHMTLWGTP